MVTDEEASINFKVALVCILIAIVSIVIAYNIVFNTNIIFNNKSVQTKTVLNPLWFENCCIDYEGGKFCFDYNPNIYNGIEINGKSINISKCNNTRKYITVPVTVNGRWWVNKYETR